MIDVMLDIETWGTDPGCDLRSIGAVTFDRQTGAVGKAGFSVACDNPWDFISPDAPELSRRRYNLVRDPRTEQWWADQSGDATAAFADPVDLREGIRQFIVWLESASRERSGEFTKTWERSQIRIWAHGPAFDVSIMEAACRAVGLPVPWHYRAPRDTRTIMEAAGMDPHKGLEPFQVGTLHNALDDAWGQAAAVCEAFRILREGASR